MKHQVGLTSTEMAALWSAYIGEGMSVCLSRFFLKHLTDEDVKPLLARSLQGSQRYLEQIRAIFAAEGIPIPRGYREEDVHMDAPPLFFALFPLSYVYSMSRMWLVNYSGYMTSSARADVRKLFADCLTDQRDIFQQAVDLMLAKGIYDRPAVIPYPDKIEFLHKKETFLSEWFEPQRPLNVLELSEIFFNIERNYFAILLLTGLIQTAQDKRIKQYLADGKVLADKQIEFLNEILIKENLLGTIMVNTEVTVSTVPPFSDRLVLGLVNLINSAGVSYLGRAMSNTMRVDLMAQYSKFMAAVLKYGHEGAELLIERGWMEEPPHAPNRKELTGLY